MSDLSLKVKLLWYSIPTIVCWSLWIEWNARVFNSGQIGNNKLLDSAFSLLYHLPAFKGVRFHDSFFIGRGWFSAKGLFLVPGGVALLMFSVINKIFFTLPIKKKWKSFVLILEVLKLENIFLYVMKY